jgi:predicted ATP-grasp superfamily ATP-dependent carboligase
MAHILITGGRAPAALELARIFKRAGHQVFTAESQANCLTQASHCVQCAFHVPPPRQNTAQFIQALKHIVQDQAIDLIVPTCEEVFYLAQGRAELAPHCQVFVEPLERLRPLHHKYTFIQLAQRFGLSVPKTALVRSPQDLRAAARRWPDWVLKPVYSRFATQTLIRPSLQQAEWACTQGQWVAQEYLPGPAYCTYSVAHQGQLSAHAVYRSEFTAGQGATVAFANCLHPAIQAWVERFCAAYHFTGQIAFDFIEDAEGRPLAIECNPRATSGVHLFANSPHLAAAFLEPGPETVLPAPDAPASMLTAAMLLYALPAALKTGRFLSWWAAFTRSQDVLWRWSDPLPTLYQVGSLLHFVALARRRGISALQASTLDIEWNGE